MNRGWPVWRWSLAFILYLLTALPSYGQRTANDPLEEALPNGAIARLGTTRFRTDFYPVLDLKIARDGQRLLTVMSGPEAVNVLVWNAATGRVLQRFPSHFSCPSADFTPDGKRVLIGVGA